MMPCELPPSGKYRTWLAFLIESSYEGPPEKRPSWIELAVEAYRKLRKCEELGS